MSWDGRENASFGAYPEEEAQRRLGVGAMREGREKNVQDAVEVEGEEGRCGLSDERVSLDDGDPQAWSGQSSNIGPSIHSSIRQGPALPYCSVAEERRSGGSESRQYGSDTREAEATV